MNDWRISSTVAWLRLGIGLSQYLSGRGTYDCGHQGGWGSEMARAFGVGMLLSALALPSCGSVPDPSEWMGTWRLTGITCSPDNGLVIQGQTVELVLRETTGDTIVKYSNGCEARMLDYIITPVVGGIDFPTSTSASVECEPNPCIGTIKVFDNAGSGSASATCPDDFPPSVSGGVIGRIDGNFITAAIQLGDLSCENRYARVR